MTKDSSIGTIPRLMQSGKKRVLFLCTGNYYRSRFAEALFNHHARRLGLGWVADSRALAIERGAENVGPISRHARDGLTARGVPPAGAERFPQGCAACDLESADLVVALKEHEHRPYLRAKFAGWEDRVTYWHVHDVDQAPPADALAQIEQLVGELVERCRARGAGETGGAAPPHLSDRERSHGRSPGG